MKTSKFAGPKHAPSIYYLTNPNHLDDIRSQILETTFQKDKYKALSLLIENLKRDLHNTDNQLFTIHLLDQIVKLERKDKLIKH